MHPEVRFKAGKQVRIMDILREPVPSIGNQQAEGAQLPNKVGDIPTDEGDRGRPRVRCRNIMGDR